MASGPNHPFRNWTGLSKKEKLDRARAKRALERALGKPAGRSSNGARARIQAAIEQEERTRRNIEALNDTEETE